MMEKLRNLLPILNQHLTVLFIPHTNLPLWRVRVSLHFMLFGLGLWTGITVWAGYIVGHDIDYWITKADNQVMRVKMAYLASEVARSRKDLERARETDKQMRVLLAMQNRRSIIESEEGVGGPAMPDRLDIGRHLQGKSAQINQAAIRKSLVALRQESQQRLASFQEIAWHITNERSVFRATPLGWPTEGRITSTFGYRFSPVMGVEAESGEFHSGLDIANNPDTPVICTADGVIRKAGWSGGFGRMVLIDHDWGYSTVYGHNSKTLVREGESVKRGQMIAYMGTTGRSTGNHLHYEVWRHGKPVNPMKFLKSKTEEGLKLH